MCCAASISQQLVDRRLRARPRIDRLDNDAAVERGLARPAAERSRHNDGIGRRAPMKQLSSMMVGAACRGSSTPPSPAPPEIWQLAPTWAQEPTVAQVSTMVFSPTLAPTLTKDGMSTAPLA